MHINATCSYYWDQFWGCSFEFDIEISGSGRIDDPYILKAISPYDSKHFELKISQSDQYLKIYGINLKALYLNHCTNINISNIRVKYLEFAKCSIISVHKAQISKEMRFDQCTDIKITKGVINRLNVFSGDQLNFYNCEINKLSKTSKEFLKEKRIMIEVFSNGSSR